MSSVQPDYAQSKNFSEAPRDSWINILGKSGPSLGIYKWSAKDDCWRSCQGILLRDDVGIHQFPNGQMQMCSPYSWRLADGSEVAYADRTADYLGESN